jgi:hypothetical protein
MHKRDIFLFDIDGVLVEPRGYRAAVQASARYFLSSRGRNSFPLPDAHDYARLEAQRITSEWDMVPLFLAAAVEQLLAQNRLPQAPARLEELASWDLPCPDPLPDYPALISPLEHFRKPGEYAAETALRVCQNQVEPPVQVEGNMLDQPRPFPHLSGSPLVRELFSDTRSVARSPVTRIFQNYCLGSEAFRDAYQLPPVLDTPSLLITEDLSLLSPALRDILLQRWRASEIDLSAYTLRPSLPPREAGARALGYSPEAEQAVELAGLAGIPIIGYGRILYLAQKYGLETETLVKPSPVQAMAAILAARVREELLALELALHLFQDRGAAGGAFARLAAGGREAAQIHVFEDSPGGIEAVLQAGDLLAEAGLQVQVTPWGITEQKDKVKALRQIGVSVFPTLTAALQEVL